MSIWQVLLIWLTAVAGMGCIGFLMAVFFSTIREADEQMARENPPRPSQPKSWQYWATFSLIYAAGTIFLQHLPTRVFWALIIAVNSVIAVFLVRSVIVGWRTQQDAHFCVKAAAICGVVAASSGCALWGYK